MLKSIAALIPALFLGMDSLGSLGGGLPSLPSRSPQVPVPQVQQLADEQSHTEVSTDSLYPPQQPPADTASHLLDRLTKYQDKGAVAVFGSEHVAQFAAQKLLEVKEHAANGNVTMEDLTFLRALVDKHRAALLNDPSINVGSILDSAARQTDAQGLGLGKDGKMALVDRPDMPLHAINPLAKDADPEVTQALRMKITGIASSLIQGWIDGMGDPPVITDTVRDQVLAKLDTIAADMVRSPDPQQFLSRDLSARIDGAIAEQLSPQDQVKFFTASLFGRDADAVQDPRARNFIALAAEVEGMSPLDLQQHVALLREVHTESVMHGADMVTALDKVDKKHSVLPPAIDLSHAQFKGMLGDASGVEKTFWLQLEDGSMVIAKKSKSLDMAANERLAHALGGDFDMPVNQVQIGQFLLDGHMETVTVHHLVGDNAQKFSRIKAELGIRGSDYRDPNHMAAINLRLARHDAYHTCASGPSSYGKPDADAYMDGLKRRVVNPEALDRMLFHDKLTDNQDRHGGNYMATVVGMNAEGQPMYKLSMIDHGRSMAWSQPVDVNARVADFTQFLQGMSDPSNGRFVANILPDLQRLADMSDDHIENKLFEGMDGMHSDEQKQQNIALLKGKRDAAIAWLANNQDLVNGNPQPQVDAHGPDIDPLALPDLPDSPQQNVLNRLPDLPLSPLPQVQSQSDTSSTGTSDSRTHVDIRIPPRDQEESMHESEREELSGEISDMTSNRPIPRDQASNVQPQSKSEQL